MLILCPALASEMDTVRPASPQPMTMICCTGILVFNGSSQQQQQQQCDFQVTMVLLCPRFKLWVWMDGWYQHGQLVGVCMYVCIDVCVRQQ